MVIILSRGVNVVKTKIHFYRTRVRLLVMLVSDSLTDSLTHSCLVNLIDVTLACENANLKLVEVVRDAVIYVLAEFVR